MKGLQKAKGEINVNRKSPKLLNCALRQRTEISQEEMEFITH